MTPDNVEADVVVVGAGLAGSSCAIRLAELGVAVVLIEQQQHPFHKLCGEFLSAEALPVLDELGILEKVQKRGIEIELFRLSAASGGMCAVRLPSPALGISRYVLDALLVERARSVGVEILEPFRVDGIRGSLEDGFVVSVNPADKQRSSDGSIQIATRCVIGAWGRRSPLDRQLRPNTLSPTPWVAFKGHYAGCDIGRCIEIHAFRGGYCGLSHVEGGLLNACWIMHRDRLPSDADDLHEAIISEVFRENDLLAGRFVSMEPVWSKPLSVSQLSFHATDPFVADVALVGDAAGMIAPLAGNGMSMALTSGAYLGKLAAMFVREELDAGDYRATYSSTWHKGFRRRMRIARATHDILTNYRRVRFAVAVSRRAPVVLRWFIAQTRGYPAAFLRGRAP